MALFDDESVARRPAETDAGLHRIGQDLSTLSLHEFAERIAALRAEIERLEAAQAAKSRSMSAAASFFKN